MQRPLAGQEKYSGRNTGGVVGGRKIIKSGPAPKPGWGKSFAPESERKVQDGQGQVRR